MNRDQTQNNPDNKATNPNPPTSLNRIAAELEKLNSHTQKQAADEEKENKLWNWRNGKKHILFIVQIITLFGTLVALFFTYKSVSVSRDAITRADTANFIAKRAFDEAREKDNASSERERRIDSINYERDTTNINQLKKSNEISNEIANYSIRSLREYQNRFEKENQSFLKFAPTVTSLDSPINIKYSMLSYGKMPLIVTNTYLRLTIVEVNNKLAIKNMIDTLKEKIKYGKYPSTETIYVPNNNDGFALYDFPHNYLFNKSYLLGIQNGYYDLFIYGKIRYINTIRVRDTIEQRFVQRFWFKQTQNIIESGTWNDYLSIEPIRNN